MNKVLTLSSKVSCDHGAPPAVPGGLLVLSAGQDVLQVGGSLVIAKALDSADIAGGCLAPNPTVPCTKTMTQIGGTSEVLHVDGAPVVLETAIGNTNGGSPQPAWSVFEVVQEVLSAD